QTYGGLAKIDYAGNAGTDGDGRNGVVVRSPYLNVHFGSCSFAQITDGSSNTLMVGEKQMNIAMFGLSTDDNEPYTRPGWNGDYEVYRLGTKVPAPDFKQPGNTTPSTRFGSAHAPAFNAVFADGSVRSIHYTVTLTVFKRACVRNDGQTFSLDDL